MGNIISIIVDPFEKEKSKKIKELLDFGHNPNQLNRQGASAL